MITYGRGWDEARLRRAVTAIARLSGRLSAAIEGGGLEVTVTASYEEDGEEHPVRFGFFLMDGAKRRNWIEPEPHSRSVLNALAGACGMRGLPESQADPASRYRSSSPPTGERVRIVLKTPDSATLRAAGRLAAMTERGDDEKIAEGLRLGSGEGLIAPWNRRRVERAALAIARADAEIGAQASGRAIEIVLYGGGGPEARSLIDCDGFYESYDPNPAPGRSGALLNALAAMAVAPGATFEIALEGDPPTASGRAALALRRGGPRDDARIVRRIEAVLRRAGA